MLKEVEATKNIEEKGMNEMQETSVKENTEVKEKDVMNETSEIKDTTAKAGDATKEIKADDKKAVKKSMATKKKATEKQTEVTEKKPENNTSEQTPFAEVTETLKGDVVDTKVCLQPSEIVSPMIQKFLSDLDAEVDKAMDLKAYTQQEIEQLKNICKTIIAEQGSMCKTYLNIAIPIFNIYTTKKYKIFNDDNIYSFAKRVFGISRGRCAEYKKVIENFGFINENTGLCTGIKAEYESYTASQLVEMSKMTPEQRAEVNDKMTVLDMKDKRLGNEAKNTEEASANDTVSSKPKKGNYQLFKGEHLESYESLEKSLLSRLSEFTDQHEAVRNIKITLSYEE